MCKEPNLSMTYSIADIANMLVVKFSDVHLCRIDLFSTILSTLFCTRELDLRDYSESAVV